MEASPICRGQNLTLETVLMFIYAMPKSEMPKSDFNAFAEKRMKGWTQTHSQIARQMALYYEDNGTCIPRFSDNIDIDDVVNYAKNWACNYFIPNPYTPSLRGQKPTNIYAYLKNEIKKGNFEFDVACNSIFGIALNNLDKVRVYLNSFTDIIIDNNKMTLNDSIFSFDEIQLNPFDEEVDARTYYENFNIALKKANKKRIYPSSLPLQQIFYGAPGTGKSHTINEITKAQPEDNVVRTTFHPDSDYSTFVGCYKPTKETSNVLSLHKLHELYPEFKKMVDNRPLHRFIAKYYNSFKLLTEKEAESVFDNIETASTVTAEVPKLMAAIEELKSAASISYSFVPQAFTNAYVKAWKSPNEPVFLIIEEINRGNCAQIFGDLFQLLDRNDDGYSCYPIDADTDLCQHLENELGKESEGIKNGKLRLPSNLYIWATMNTSDQSLFPIDSAFKRRWDWVYRPIGYKNSNWTIEIGDKKYNWVDFQKAINQKIYDVDNSEDKQLGDYFVNADRTDFKISADTLLNKILFYIWNDVCKDDPDQIFRCKTDKEEECVKFSDFFDDKIKKLQGFMAFIGVAPYGENKENKQEMPLDTETTETTDTPKE